MKGNGNPSFYHYEWFLNKNKPVSSNTAIFTSVPTQGFSLFVCLFVDSLFTVITEPLNKHTALGFYLIFCADNQVDEQAEAVVQIAGEGERNERV